MKEITSTITSKGQLTVPLEIRKLLGLKERDKVAFVIEDDQTIRFRPVKYPNVRSLLGTARSKDPSLSWQEMRDIARAEALEDKARRTK